MTKRYYCCYISISEFNASLTAVYNKYLSFHYPR